MLSARVKRLVVPLLFLAPCVARAGGPLTGPRTALELARAGAQHAEPRTAAALCSNPSALAGLRGLQLQVEGNLIVDQRSLTPPGGRLRKNAAGPTLNPGIFASYNLGSVNVPNITLAVGWYAPAQHSRSLPDGGPQRFAETAGSETRRDLGMAVGYELPWFGLRLGATALLAQVSAQHSLDVQLGSIAAPVSLRAAQANSVGGLFAVSAAPVPWLLLAASYQLAQDVRLTGNATLPNVPGLAGNQVDVVARLPGMAQASAQFRDLQDRFDVELSFAWENWQRTAQVQVLPGSDLKLNGGQIPELDVDYGYRDAWSLRLGGRYRVPAERAIAVYGGAFYRHGVVDDAHLSAAAWDPPTWGLGAGARVALIAMSWVEVAAGLNVPVATTVTASRVHGGALDARNAPTPGPVAGNGRYGGFEALFALALGAALDL